MGAWNGEYKCGCRDQRYMGSRSHLHSSLAWRVAALCYRFRRNRYDLPQEEKGSSSRCLTLPFLFSRCDSLSPDLPTVGAHSVWRALRKLREFWRPAMKRLPGQQRTARMLPRPRIARSDRRPSTKLRGYPWSIKLSTRGGPCQAVESRRRPDEHGKFDE